MKVLFVFLGTLFPLFSLSAKVDLNTRVFLGQKAVTAQNSVADWNDTAVSELAVIPGAKIEFWNTELNLKGYFRASQGNIFTEDQNTTELQSSLFPQQIIARDVLKSHHKKIRDEKYEEALLYQSSYSWGDEDVTFTVGRFPVKFGHGGIINPVNPLNHNPAISPIYLDQVNDGAQIAFHTEKDHRVYLYLFGDKSYTDYDEDIKKTILLRGEVQLNPKNTITYILGEDQKRHKYGFEWLSSFKSGEAYMQGIRYSQPIDQDKNEKGLFHYLIGANYDMTSTFSFKSEIGKFQLSEEEESKVINNYLPFEDFISIGGYFRHSDKWNSEIDLIQDPGPEASIYRITSTYKLSNNLNASLYQLKLSKSADEDSRFTYQNSFTDQIGLILRGNF